MPEPDRIELNALLLHVHIGLQSWLLSNDAAPESPSSSGHQALPCQALKQTLDQVLVQAQPLFEAPTSEDPYFSEALLQEMGNLCVYLTEDRPLASLDQFRLVDGLTRLAIGFNLPHHAEFQKQRALYWEAVELPTIDTTDAPAGSSPEPFPTPLPAPKARSPLEVRDAVFYDLEWLLAPYRSLPTHSIARIEVLLFARTAAELMVLNDYFNTNLTDHILPALHRHLREADLSAFETLPITFSVSTACPEDMPEAEQRALQERGFHITLHNRTASTETTEARDAQLRLIKGGTRSMNQTFTLNARTRTVYIGRMATVQQGAQGIRYNQICFEDENRPEYAEVSRAHASIQYDPVTRTYKIRDDGSRFGTRILRGPNRMTLPVRRHFRTLEAGDRIQLGSNVTLEFQYAPAPVPLEAQTQDPA